MTISDIKKNQQPPDRGFTLIEILIVVMILGILAMVIVPQINVSMGDTKESTLQTNFAILQNAIELYYHEHDNSYPGERHHLYEGDNADGSTAATSFLKQMTQHSLATGIVSSTKTADGVEYPYGPYIKSDVLPANPYQSEGNQTTIICDLTEDDITQTPVSISTGWYFFVQTGRLFAYEE